MNFLLTFLTGSAESHEELKKSLPKLKQENNGMFSIFLGPNYTKRNHIRTYSIHCWSWMQYECKYDFDRRNERRSKEKAFRMPFAKMLLPKTLFCYMFLSGLQRDWLIVPPQAITIFYWLFKLTRDFFSGPHKCSVYSGFGLHKSPDTYTCIRLFRLCYKSHFLRC